MSEQCRICHGRMQRWIDMPIDPIKSEPTTYGDAIRCETCGLGHVTPLPAADEVPAFYALSSYYTHGQSHIPPVVPNLIDRALIKAAYLTEQPNPFTADEVALRLPAGARVIDLGCGGAALLQQLRARGFDVLGVDPDQGAIAAAREKGIEVVQGTAEDVPQTVPRASFDLVVMSHSLEHCLDPLAAIETALALIKPDGLIYVEVPNCDNIHFQTMEAASGMYDAPRHLWFFTHEALRRIMAARGLAPVGWFYSGFLRHFTPDWRRYEASIHRRAQARGPATTREHNLWRSIATLARETIAPRNRKYDSVGILMRIDA